MKRVINDCPKQVRSKIGRGFMSLKIARKLKFFSAQPASLCCPAANTLSLILQQVDQMFKSLITAISLFAMFFAVETHGQEPARVRVADGTLVSSDGKVLRGTTFFVDMYGVPDMRENETKYHEYFNSVFKKHPDLNCVRVGPWMGDWKYDVAGNEQHREEYLYAIDTLVDWCAENGVYAIVNLHIQYNTKVDSEKAKAFWSLIAPRYKDRTHVVYELLNEPEPKTSLAVSNQIYQHVKSLAPETHQILFSHVAATQLTIDGLAKATEGVDFKNASIGFHCYDNVLLNTKQWDHAEKIRAAGYPIICTEFISLTNNNDMPIQYDYLMHCMMRAEERKMAWISWGPFAQLRNPNKKGWTNNALRYSPDFTAALQRYGVDLARGPQWPADGNYRLRCVDSDQYLIRTSDDAWKTVTLGKDDAHAVWALKRYDGNNYRIRNANNEKIALHGKFDDDKTWQESVTADRNDDWSSQKFQLLRTGKNTFMIRCRWGELYLTGSEGKVRTAPLTGELTQHWQLEPN